MNQRGAVAVRNATESDLDAIINIARATGQHEDWNTVFPDYIRHLINHGRLLVAAANGDTDGDTDGDADGAVIGFGGARLIGTGPDAISMLTDLFVDPAVHGTGAGRTILTALWAGQARKMTFSSLHSNALPLYTSFGVDAWWPLLYLGGEISRLDPPAGFSVEPAEPADVAALERAWTGVDRTADHELWAARPAGVSVIVSRGGQPVAAGTGGGADREYGIAHLVTAPAGAGGDRGDQATAADAVLAVLSWRRPADGRANVCLPAPHPAVRRLLAAGWKVSDLDLYMASEPDLIDPFSVVPSPGLA